MKLQPILTTALMLTAFAGAATASPLGAAGSYSVFIFDSATVRGSEIAGGIATGGSASLSQLNVGTKLSPDSGRYDVVVGGALSFGNGQISNGSGISGGAAAVYSFNAPNGTVTSNVGYTGINSIVDFNSEAMSLTKSSEKWGELAQTGTANYQYGGYILNGSENDLNVFHLDAALLDQANYMNIVVPTGSTVLFNVYGDVAGLTSMGFNGLSNYANVLFNFVDATTLNLNGVGVPGTILAPHATVNFENGDIKGTLIAKHLKAGNGGTSFKGGQFAGTLPGDDPAEVPEPSTYALAAAGLIALGVAKRKK